MALPRFTADQERDLTALLASDDPAMVAIVGPTACGKSTLLKNATADYESTGFWSSGRVNPKVYVSSAPAYALGPDDAPEVLVVDDMYTFPKEVRTVCVEFDGRKTDAAQTIAVVRRIVAAIKRGVPVHALKKHVWGGPMDATPWMAAEDRVERLRRVLDPATRRAALDGIAAGLCARRGVPISAVNFVLMGSELGPLPDDVTVFRPE